MNPIWRTAHATIFTSISEGWQIGANCSTHAGRYAFLHGWLCLP
jgi:muramidase (phage lysozyme)